MPAKRNTIQLNFDANFDPVARKAKELSANLNAATSNMVDKQAVKELRTVIAELKSLQKGRNSLATRATDRVVEGQGRLIEIIAKELKPLLSQNTAASRNLRRQTSGVIKDEARERGVSLSRAELSRLINLRIGQMVGTGKADTGVSQKYLDSVVSSINKQAKSTKEVKTAMAELRKEAKRVEEASKSLTQVNKDALKLATTLSVVEKALSDVNVEMAKLGDAKASRRTTNNQIKDLNKELLNTKRILREINAQKAAGGLVSEGSISAGVARVQRQLDALRTERAGKTGAAWNNTQRKNADREIRDAENWLLQNAPGVNYAEQAIRDRNKRTAQAGTDRKSARRSAFNVTRVMRDIQSGKIDIGSLGADEVEQLLATMNGGRWALGRFSNRSLAQGDARTSQAIVRTLGISSREEASGIHQNQVRLLAARQRELDKNENYSPGLRGIMERTQQRAYNRRNDSNFNRLNHGVTNMSQMAGMSLYGMGSLGLFTGIAKTTITQQAEMQSMKNTLAGMVNTYGTFYDMQGKVLDKQQSFNLALAQSDTYYQNIRKLAVESILTTQEMFDYTLAGGSALMSKGLSFDQSSSVVDKIASIGKAMGYQPTAVMSDIRDLATGNVTVRSQVLKTLGFEGADLKKANAQGPEATLAYINSRLAGFEPALNRLKDTPMSRISQAQDQFQQMGILVGGEILEGYLPALKDFMGTLQEMENDGTLRQFGEGLGQATETVTKFGAFLAKTIAPMAGSPMGMVAAGIGVYGGAKTVGNMYGAANDAFMAKYPKSGATGGLSGPLFALTAVVGFGAAMVEANNELKQFSKNLRETSSDIDKKYSDAELEKNSPKSLLATLESIVNPSKNLEGTSSARANLKNLERLNSVVNGKNGLDFKGLESLSKEFGVSYRMGKVNDPALAREPIKDLLRILTGRTPGTGADILAAMPGASNNYANIVAGELDYAQKQYVKKATESGLSIDSSRAKYEEYLRTNPTGFTSLLELTRKRAAGPEFKPIDDNDAMMLQERLTLLKTMLAAQSSVTSQAMSMRAETDPYRAVYLAQQKRLGVSGARLDLQTALTKEGASDTDKQVAQIQYLQSLQEIDQEFQKGLQTLRATIMAKRMENDLARDRLGLLKQDMQIQRQETALDRLSGAASNDGKRSRLRYNIYSAQLNRLNSETGLDLKGLANDSRLASALSDPFEKVVGFFGDLKSQGFPDIKIQPTDLNFLGELYKQVDATTGQNTTATQNLTGTIVSLDTSVGSLQGVLAQFVTATAGGAVVGGVATGTGTYSGKGDPSNSGLILKPQTRVGYGGSVDKVPGGLILDLPGTSAVDGFQFNTNTPYKWGGSSLTKGIDCSGLVGKILEYSNQQADEVVDNAFLGRQNVESLYKTAAKQNRLLPLDQIKPGDFIMMSKNSTFSSSGSGGAQNHIVQYLGDDKILHSKGGKGVSIDSYSAFRRQYAGRNMVGARLIGAPTGIGAAQMQSGNGTGMQATVDKYQIERNNIEAQAVKLRAEAEAQRLREQLVSSFIQDRLSVVNRQADRYSFKSGLALSMVGLGKGEAGFQSVMNSIMLGEYDFNKSIDFSRSDRAVAYGEGELAYQNSQRSRSAATRKAGQAKFEALKAKLNKEELADLEKQSGFERQKKDLTHRQTKAMEAITKVMAEGTSALDFQSTQALSLYGLTGDAAKDASFGARAEASRESASRILGKGREKAEELAKQAAMIAPVNPIMASYLMLQATQTYSTARADADLLLKEGANISAMGANSTAMRSLSQGIALSKSNYNLAGLEGVYNDTLGYDPSRRTTMLESAKNRIADSLKERLLQIEESENQDRLNLYYGLAATGQYSPAQLQSIMSQQDHKFEMRKSKLKALAYSDATSQISRMDSGRLRRLDSFNEGFAGGASSFYNDPLGSFMGRSLQFGKDLFGPATANTMQTLQNKVSLFAAMSAGTATPDMFKSMGFTEVDSVGGRLFRGPGGQTLTPAQLKAQLLRNSAYDMGGSLLGNYIGRQMGGDEAAVNFGTQMGATFLPQILPGLGAMGGPVGMILGGALGGLFSRKKREDVTEAWMREVLKELREMNKALRPSAQFDSVRGPAMYGEASFYRSGRSSDPLGSMAESGIRGV